jgi:UDP-N-acetylglucosamine 2-epimerase (non-hydrolysing)
VSGFHTAAFVVGTRPEAVKLGPVVAEMRAAGLINPIVVASGQQSAAVAEVLAVFGLAPDVTVAPPPAGRGVTALTAHLLASLGAELDRLHPDLVIVQGDTASTLAGALAGFLHQIPVVHVEAGLRTHDLAAPFPEEGNRRMVSGIAALHLAPTVAAVANLTAEGIDPGRILLTGNTVVDALRAVTHADAAPAGPPLVLVTAHRRENWGEPIARVGAAIALLAGAHPDWEFEVVGHLNPAVRATLAAAVPPGANVSVHGPMPYVAFVRLLGRATLAITDSGGVQEEAPALGVPVLVTRESTERREALDAGLAQLVGTDPAAIVTAAEELVAAAAMLPAVRRPTASPFGDGHAGERSAAACAWLLGLGPRPEQLITMRHGLVPGPRTPDHDHDHDRARRAPLARAVRGAD